MKSRLLRRQIVARRRTAPRCGAVWNAVARRSSTRFEAGPPAHSPRQQAVKERTVTAGLWPAMRYASKRPVQAPSDESSKEVSPMPFNRDINFIHFG
jgi:hypothetical protein